MASRFRGVASQLVLNLIFSWFLSGNVRVVWMERNVLWIRTSEVYPRSSKEIVCLSTLWGTRGEEPQEKKMLDCWSTTDHDVRCTVPESIIQMEKSYCISTLYHMIKTIMSDKLLQKWSLIHQECIQNPVGEEWKHKYLVSTTEALNALSCSWFQSNWITRKIKIPTNNYVP